MLKKAAALGLAFAMMAAPMFANEGDVPKGVPHLDHVFVIMMENHAYGQIVGNPSAPFANKLMQSANAANNYFAVAHPSLTNYLEVVGGSNFGVLNDNSPDWHNTNCTTNLASAITDFDNNSNGVCPIWGAGTDAATPAFDFTNETAPPAITEVTNIDGIQSIPAATNISGKTIADQLDEHGMSWKSYQENLPAAGADDVNNSDGYFSNLLSITSVLPAETQTLINLYAVKHNPFAYFQKIQQGNDSDSSLKNMVGFGGKRGLFEDLESGNAGPVCDFDPSTLGTQVGLNPALIYQGDLTLRNLVKAIHGSPAWKDGNNAIVILWDENDYSATPNVNKVLLIVNTNYGAKGVQSSEFYTHFSLLRTIEGGFGLPCLNHACDKDAKVMSDLFGHDKDHDGKW
jgi:hypothetical protein